MKAAFIERYGPAEAIRHGELPMPQVRAGDVLVRVGAITVNHVDTYIRGGGVRSPTPFPFVIGRDMTGTVEAVGRVSRRSARAVACGSAASASTGCKARSRSTSRRPPAARRRRNGGARPAPSW